MFSSFPSLRRITDTDLQSDSGSRSHTAGDSEARRPEESKWLGKMPQGPKTFLASWSSAQPRASSSCQTHKESEQHIAAAARTAGYLLAVTESGQLWSQIVGFSGSILQKLRIRTFRKLPISIATCRTRGRLTCADRRRKFVTEVSLRNDFGPQAP